MPPKSRKTAAADLETEATAHLADIEQKAKALLLAHDRDDFALGRLWIDLKHGKWLKEAKQGQASAWWTQHVSNDPGALRTAKLLGRIAGAFSEDVVERYHPSTLDLYLRYCEAKGLTAATDPGMQVFRIPAGDHYANKVFSTCTRDDLRAAIRDAGPRKNKPPTATLPPPQQAFLTHAQQQLAPLFQGHLGASFSGVRRGGTALYTLRLVPGDVLADVLAALTEAVHGYRP